MAAASSSSPFTTNPHPSTTPRCLTQHSYLQSSFHLLDAERSRTCPSPPATIRPVNLEFPPSSSISTSLPRTQHDPAGNRQHDGHHPRDLPDTTAVIVRTAQSNPSPPISAGRSGGSHGRKSVKGRPGTPGGPLAKRATPRSPSHAPPLPSTNRSTPMTSSTAPASSPSPSLGSPPSAPPPPPSFSSKRPSLASPLPPSPIVPSNPFPKPTFPLVPPSPLNVSPSSSPAQIRHHPTASGSLPTPQPQSPTTAQGQILGQGWSHPQYLTAPRPNTGKSTLPDSPSTRALLKRLLAKPAPISPSHLSTTGETDSEGPGSHSHTRKDSSSLSSTGRAVMNDGLHQSEPIVVGDGGVDERPLPPAESPKEAKGGEKDKEKGLRNVLRRRPSASKQTSQAQSPQPPPETSAAPPPRSTSKGREPAIPPLGAFSPLGTFSPLTMLLTLRTSPEQKSGQPPSSPSSKANAPEPVSHLHQPQKPDTTTSATPRSDTASAAPMSHSTTHNTSGKTMQFESPNLISQQVPSPGGTSAALTSFLRPPLPYEAAAGSAMENADAPTSCGTSPAGSHIVSTSTPGTPSPTSTSETSSGKPSPPVPSPSEQERQLGVETEKTGDKEKELERIRAATPASSLIEAYKRREREREEQRITIERVKERQMQMQMQLLQGERRDAKEAAGSVPTTGTDMPAPTNGLSLLLGGGDAGSSSAPPNRRHSLRTMAASIVSDGIAAGDRKRSQSPGSNKIDDVELKRKSGGGSRSGSIRSSGVKSRDVDPDRPVAVITSGSSPKVHSFRGGNNTSESGHGYITPRMGGGNPSEILGAGKGPGAIEKMAGGRGRSADTGAADVPSASQEERARTTSNKSGTVSSRSLAVRRGLEDINAKPALESHHLRPYGYEEEVVAPYYTVFGSTSGHTVAVGGREESQWDTYHQGYWDSNMLGRRNVSDKEKDKSKERPGRSLTRKVSGRMKKQNEVVVGTLDHEGATAGKEQTQGRSSMQELRRGGSIMRKGEGEEEKRMRMRSRRSLRLSIDKFSDVVGAGYDARLAPRPGLPENGHGGHAGVESDGNAGYGTTKAKKADGGSPGGNRFWALIRRINVAGLKDNGPDTEPPPPVPALPKDLCNRSLRSQRSETFKKNSAVASTSSTFANPHRTAPPKSRPLPSSPPSSNHPRQSTTRSPSPVSSDVASLKFFHFPHSTQSSESSFAEDGNHPPIPTTKAPQFSQHIIAPRELAKDSMRSPVRRQPPPNIPIPNQRMDEDWAIVQSPTVEFTSLPPPPRRPTLNPNSFGCEVPQFDRPESPTIPSFSTNDAVNAFPPRRPLSALSENSPNPARASPASVSEKSSPLPTSLPPSPRLLETSHQPMPGLVEQQPIVKTDDIPSGRKSESHARIHHDRGSSSGLSSTSTTRPARHRSKSIGGIIPSHLFSPSTTADAISMSRELDGLKKQALTDKEKADKWDALMEKTARAGGTIHLAGSALPSDRWK